MAYDVHNMQVYLSQHYFMTLNQQNAQNFSLEICHAECSYINPQRTFIRESNLSNTALNQISHLYAHDMV